MATDGRVNVEITGTVDGLDAAMDRASASVRTATTSMQTNTEKIGSAFEGLGRRFEHSGVMIAFAVNNMMDGTQTGVTRALHSIALLGFAFGPVVGAVSTAVALILEHIDHMVKESAHLLEEFQKKMADFVNAGNVAELMKKKEELLVGQPLVDGKLAGKSELVPGAWKGGLEDLGATYRKLAADKREADKLLFGAGEAAKIQKEMNAISDEYSAKKKQLDQVDADLDAAETRREQMSAGGNLKTTITVKSDKRAKEDAAKAAKEKLDLSLALERSIEKVDEEGTKAAKKYLDEQIEATHKAVVKRLEENDKAGAQEAEMREKALHALQQDMREGEVSIAKTAAENARLTEEQWTRAMEGIRGAFERAFGEMQQRGGNFAGFMRKVGQQLLGDMVRNELRALEAHIAVSKAKQASDEHGAAKSKALSAAQALSSITDDAAAAAASVFAGTTKFFAFLGPLAPALGGIAAGATFAAVEAFGALTSAAGGFDVPAGLNPVTQLHAQEMVLPANLANAVRSMAAGGGGGGGDVHVHVHALDSADVHAWARKNTEPIGRAALTHMQRGGALPAAAGRRA
jgi:hypothetical protein